MKKFLFSVICAGAFSFVYAQQITVNQTGYLIHQLKLAVVQASVSGQFIVVDNATDEIRFTGELSASATWSYAGQAVRIADFTEFNDTGTFRIKVDAAGIESFPFRISNTTFYDLSKESLKFYYLSRVSMPLEEAYAGVYARAAGHPDTSVIIHASAASAERPEGTRISTPRGWYDAGDYNKYVVNAGISNYTVFAIAEHFPEYAAKLDLNIPESSNSVPDIIDEGVYDLRWMLSMQDPNDGGVYHKCTEKNFSGMITPAQAASVPRYVVMKTTSATLDMAAVAAQASRLLRNYESEYPGLADSCLSAAVYAYEWARAHPAVYYQQPSDITTGGYGDNNVTDEFRWTAMELYITTKDDLYLSHYNYLDRNANTPGWGSVYSLGLISLVRNADSLTAAVDIGAVKQKIIDYSDNFYTEYLNSAYRVPITTFNWGSNGNLGNGGLMSLQAYYLTGEEKYLDAAIASLDYLLGRNPTLYSYVTGFGSQSPMHPHDRKSQSDGVVDPLPAMLVGGANPYNTTDCGSGAYPSTLPALSYLDELCSYSTNEITINWNAPLAYLTCALQALQQPLAVKAYTGSDDSTVVKIEFDMELDTNTVNSGDFTLKVNESEGIYILNTRFENKNTLILELEDYIASADSGLLLGLQGGNLRSTLGTLVPGFDSMPVLNLVNGSAPVPLEAYSDTHEPAVYLKFSKKMVDPAVYIADFVLKNSGIEVTNTGIALEENDSMMLRLTVEIPLTYKDTLTLNYVGNSYHSADGGLLKKFMDYHVRNMFYTPSEMMRADIHPFGTELSLFFSKNLVDTSVHDEEFVFARNNNDPVAIIDARLDQAENSKVILTLAEEIVPVDTNLLLSYQGNRLLSAQLIPVESFGPLNISNTVTYPHTIPGTIEAEDFVQNIGYQFETCTDNGGGENLGYADAGDYIDYLANVTSGGLYTITYRFACNMAGSRFRIVILPDTPIDTVTVPSTGDWQNWENMYSLVNLNSGKQLIRIETQVAAFNLNWIKFDEGNVIPESVPEVISLNGTTYSIYPNPIRRGRLLTIEINSPRQEKLSIELIDLQGKIQRIFFEGSAEAGSSRELAAVIDSDLSPGIYLLKISGTSSQKQLLVSIE